MATNQVLHGSNRVVEHPNRYKLNAVAGQSNVYDFEKQPGLITDNGTPYNKNILDKIDNVLSYLIPTIEEKTIDFPVSLFVGRLNAVGITPNDFQQYSLFDNLLFRFSEIYKGIEPSLKIYSSKGKKLCSGIPSDYGNNGLYIVDSSSRFTPTYFINAINNDSNQIYLYFCSTDESTIFDYDLLLQGNYSFKYMYKSSSCKLKVLTSNDKITWVEQYNGITSNVDIDLNITNSRYLRLEFSQYQSNNQVSLNCKITNFEYNGVITTLVNNLNTGTNTSFINNQRLLIETPQELTNEHQITVNDIACDIGLIPNTRYELTFDEAKNVFEVKGMDVIPLFDITIEQSVRQVDLTGIYEKLEYGKLYALIVSVPSGSNASFYFGTNAGGYVANNQFVSLTLFLKSKLSNYISIYYPAGHGASSTYRTSSSNLSGYENIRFDSANFAVGSRIIIKEVA